jgi:transposase-like protein
MISESPFKWRQFEGQIILLCMRWYLRYCLSYLDLEEMMAERNLNLEHTTIPEADQRLMASSDDLHQSQREVDVPVPSGGLGR